MGVNHLDRRRFLEHLLSAGAGAAIMPASLATARPRAFPSSARTPQETGFVLCVFSKHLQFLSDYGALAEAAAKIGFAGVDLTVRPEGHVLPENAARDLPRAVEALRGAGLQVPTIATAITSADQDHARAVLETAAALGIPGYRMGYLHYESTPNVVATLDALKPQMEALAALNEELGIHGDYQNHDGTYVGSPVWDLSYLFQDLDPIWLGVQYDVRHATVEGAQSWPLGLDLVAPRIHSLVIKDFRWSADASGLSVEDMPLGRGVVDFPAFWQRIRGYGIRVPISMHFEYPMPGAVEPLAPENLRSQTIEVMQRDLNMLRKMMVQAGIG